jgi:hypothetical protein
MEDEFDVTPCDYCGGNLHPVTAKCSRCASEYAQGAEDYRAYKDALMVGGEDLAVRMEMEAEYGYMG